MILIKFVKSIAKTIVIFLVILTVLTYHSSITRRKIQSLKIWSLINRGDTRYILIWSHEDPNLKKIKMYRDSFIENKCKYNNCYVTKNRYYLNNDYTKFDAILLSGKMVSYDKYLSKLPKKRSINQKYFFATQGPASNYPVCNKMFDNYFNFTWTYKLDSDAVWGFYSIIDDTDTIVGPKFDMNWQPIRKSFYDFDYAFINKVSEPFDGSKENSIMKDFTATWFVSACKTSSKREFFAEDLRRELKRHDLKMQVVGKCGSRECSQDDEHCLEILNNFYFYLAFESSISEDYVTEKVLKAFLYHSVPVVYGGANYSRFLPPHTYIDARSLGAKKTADLMARLLKNKTEYTEYFYWHKYYKIVYDKQSVCSLCEAVNKNIKQVYGNFREWWNIDYIRTCKNRAWEPSNEDDVLD